MGIEEKLAQEQEAAFGRLLELAAQIHPVISAPGEEFAFIRAVRPHLASMEKAKQLIQAVRSGSGRNRMVYAVVEDGVPETLDDLWDLASAVQRGQPSGETTCEALRKYAEPILRAWHFNGHYDVVSFSNISAILGISFKDVNGRPDETLTRIAQFSGERFGSATAACDYVKSIQIIPLHNMILERFAQWSTPNLTIPDAKEMLAALSKEHAPSHERACKSILDAVLNSVDRDMFDFGICIELSEIMQSKDDGIFNLFLGLSMSVVDTVARATVIAQHMDDQQRHRFLDSFLDRCEFMEMVGSGEEEADETIEFEWHESDILVLAQLVATKEFGGANLRARLDRISKQQGFEFRTSMIQARQTSRACTNEQCSCHKGDGMPDLMDVLTGLGMAEGITDDFEGPGGINIGALMKAMMLAGIGRDMGGVHPGRTGDDFFDQVEG